MENHHCCFRCTDSMIETIVDKINIKEKHEQS